jgi:hypothetical protein
MVYRKQGIQSLYLLRLYPLFLFSAEYSFPTALRHRCFAIGSFAGYLKTNLFLKGDIELGIDTGYISTQALLTWGAHENRSAETTR